MAVVRRYQPSLDDLFEDLVIWLDRRNGSAIPRRPRRAAEVGEEKEEIRRMTAPELVAHLAGRFVDRRPRSDELIELLGLSGGRELRGPVWYPSAGHPLLTGALIAEQRGRVRELGIWSRDLSLGVSIAELVRLFGRYGHPRWRLARDRDGETFFDFRSFRGGHLKQLIATTRESVYSPADKHDRDAELAAAVAAARRDREDGLVVFDRDEGVYRAVSEEEVLATSFTFSFELAGERGPYGLFWLRKRTVHVPD